MTSMKRYKTSASFSGVGGLDLWSCMFDFILNLILTKYNFLSVFAYNVSYSFIHSFIHSFVCFLKNNICTVYIKYKLDIFTVYIFIQQNTLGIKKHGEYYQKCRCWQLKNNNLVGKELKYLLYTWGLVQLIILLVEQVAGSNVYLI